MAQQMLTSLETTPRATPLGRNGRKSRSSYSLALKLRALEEVEECGLRVAAANLSLDERVLRQWLLKSDALKEAGRHHSGGALRVRRLRSHDHEDDDQPDQEVHNHVTRQLRLPLQTKNCSLGHRCLSARLSHSVGRMINMQMSHDLCKFPFGT